MHKAQLESQKYHSTVWSNSIEAGYAIPFASSSRYQWLATPQAQIIYNYYDANNQYDSNFLYVSNHKASGFDTRLGVRFQGRAVEQNLVEPFLEVNWLRTSSKNRLDFNYQPFSDGLSKNRGEVKIGLQGNINNQWSVSVQAGGQWGNNDYESYQGQLNINYKF